MKPQENPKPAPDAVLFAPLNGPSTWFILAVAVLSAAALLFPFYL